MGLDIELLEQSFQAVAPKGEQLAARFYERLFQKYPAVRPLFTKVNITRQQKKLLSALVLVIGNLRKPDKLKPVLLDLGAKHVGYGAEPAHYAAVGENLLAVLQEFAGPAWTNEVRQAWVEAYDFIKHIMLEGAEQFSPQKYPRRQTAASLMNLGHTRSLQKGENIMGGISEKINNWSLATKLSILFCLFGLVPIMALGYMSWLTGQDMKAKVGKQFENAAVAVADKIDRNLFERYGDVQAFAINDAVKRTSRWYDSSQHSALAPLMDQYITTYGIYYLTLMVDTKGELVAVNYHDWQGNPINYQFLFEKDFSKTAWFQALANKEFTTSTPFSTEGNRGSTGTYIEDVHVDEDVKRAYPGDNGMTIGFSAPVYDDNGEVLGYWSNRAKFSLVEEIVATSYQEIKSNGYPGAEITLLDSVGRVIMDFDPMVHGKEEANHNFEKILFKLNLAEKGVKAAQEAVAGKTGYVNAMHARKKIAQASGYTHLKGALGYPGMNWAVLVRIPEEEAAADAKALMQKVMLVAIGCLVLILPMGLWIGRKGGNQIKGIKAAAEKMATGDYHVSVDVYSQDEIGQMGEAFNVMADQIQRNFESKMEALDKTQAVIDFNLDGTIITANENFCKTVGYTLEEIKGKHHRMFADPAYAASPEYAEFWAKLNRGEFDAGQYKRIGKGGKEIWIQASYNPIFDSKGTIFKVTKFAIDITSFMNQVAEYESRNVAVGNGNAVIDFTPDGIILDANENFCKTVGYTLEEIKGKHHRMFADPAYAASPEYAEFWAKLNRGEFDAGQYKRIGKGGKEVWIQASYNPILDNEGKTYKVVKFATEVTEAKKNEMAATRVKNMMENMPINVMYVDRDLVLRYMNPHSVDTLRKLEHVLPVKADQMIGACIDVFHKNPAHQRKILGDPKNFPYQTNIQLGEETLDLLVSAIFDNDGNYIGTMATWEIITDKLEQERQIKEAAEREREQAQRLQEGVSEIAQIGTNLAGASEELTSVSNTMGSTAEETSSQANVVAAAAEEVSKNVQSVSTGSEEMTASIQEIAKNTTDAARVAAQAVTVAESTNATVGKLGQSSAEIGSIIKVITTIAEQTNLLALNATIEAARAGDAGKGFAVVANEVKELAKETTKATENISRMIETIQEDTKGSVDAIEEISTIIKQVNDYMNTIASAVEEQTVTTNEMARNVTEASKGSTEIAGNIVSVADAARGTTEGATQTQQASSELSRMASDLQRVVATLT